MFKNMNREEHFSRAKGPVAPSNAAGHVAASLRHDAQESPWISMLALVSRPALSLLHRVLPGRARAPALPDGGVSGWPSGESAFLGQLHDVMPAVAQHPAQHLAFLHCQHGDSWLTAESLAELGIQNADEFSAKQRTSVGYFATARSFLSQVVMNAPLAQESRHEDAGHVLGGRVWSAAAVCSPVKSGGGNGNWWGGFWGAEDHSPSWLSNLSRGKEATGPPPPPRNAQQQHSSGHCLSSESGTKAAAVAMPTALFARCRDAGPAHDGESAGPCCPHKEDNDGLQTARTESLSSSLRGLPLEHRLEHSLVSAGVAASCSSEVAVLTPDLDNGYSSLEEEHATCRPTPAVTDAPCEDPGALTETREEDGAFASVCGSGTQEESGEQRGGDEEEEEESGAAGDMDREEEEEEEVQDSDISDSEEEEDEEEEEEEEAPSAATPVCQNKAIAYIMGSPCSDDSDSQSDDPLSEDDDGFDSEGSSDFSDSDDDSDEDTDESDSEAAADDDEAERLWSSLCRSTDPYSPRNFTASLHSAGPRTVPPPNSTSSSAGSPPSSSPLDLPPSPLLSSSPPASPPTAESWDESSASEADDAESQRLWNAFSASSDPYSPLNFQGPLRTRAPACPGAGAGGRVRGRKGRVHPPPPPPPRSRRHGTPPSSPPSSSPPVSSSSPPGPSPEAEEERLDSGFSEGLAVAVATATVTIIAAAATGYGPHGFTVKKVSFCEQVEEFYASGGEEEDRRGPWEELARDRFRFRRRVQETEENIGYVLAPAFRSLAYQRLQLLLRPPHHHHQHHHS